MCVCVCVCVCVCDCVCTHMRTHTHSHMDTPLQVFAPVYTQHSTGSRFRGIGVTIGVRV